MISTTNLGSGHGLFATLRADRQVVDHVTAVVTVTDNGGSPGCLRRELGQIPPGDLRMVLAVFSADTEEGDLWGRTLQHRFGGAGVLARHVTDNLTIAGLASVVGNGVDALDEIGRLLQIQGRVVPISPIPLETRAEAVGLEQDVRAMCQIRDQVAVTATPGQMRRIRLIPEAPSASEEAIEAILNADLMTLGLSSWFTSALPRLQVPGLRGALQEARATTVVVLNLVTEPGETAGFSSERHIHMLTQHAPNLKLSYMLVGDNTPLADTKREYLQRATGSLDAKVVFADVQEADGREVLTGRHSPEKLAAAFRQFL